jgi:hypothetical protein
MSADIEISLSTDRDDSESIPYFLWDEPMTVAEFRQHLRTASMAERVRSISYL